MNREIKTTLALDGEKAFKAAMADASREMRVLNSEMKASKAAFAGQENSTEALTSKSRILNAQIEQQKAIVAALAQAVKDAAEKYGDADKKTDSYRIQLNNAQAALSKMENELGDTKSSLNSFGTELDQEENKAGRLHSALSKVGEGLKSFAGAAGQAAVTGIKAIGAATAAAATGAFVMGKQAVEAADETQRLADVTGYTAEQIQIMQFQGKALGVDIETMTGAQAKLTKAMDAAQAGGKTQVAAFKELGVSVVGANGSLRNAKDVMADALTALGKISNETERDAMAMKVFGKSAMELNPLIKAGGDTLQYLANKAVASGAVMSNEAVAGLDDFGDSLDSLKQSMTGIAGTALSALQPALKGAVEQLQGLATAAATALKTGNWSEFASFAGKLATDMIGQITMMLPAFIQVGTQILTSLITALVAAVPEVLPQLTAGLLQLFNAIVQMVIDNGPMLIECAITAIGTLVQGLLSALPQLADAAIQILLALVDGITRQLPVLIPAAIAAVLKICQALIDNLPLLIDAAIQLVLALVDGLIKALPELLKAAPKLVKSLCDGITKSLPRIIDAAIQLIIALVEGLIDNLPMLIDAAIQILSALAQALITNLPTLLRAIPKLFAALVESFTTMDWGKIGKNIIDGIKNGVTNAAKALANAVSKAAQDALQAAKDALGIRSPSKVMEEQVGMQIGAGMANGILGSTAKVKAAMAQMSGNLTATAKTSLALDASGKAAARAGSFGNITLNVYGNINSRSDAMTMAEKLDSLIAARSRGLGVVPA